MFLGERRALSSSSSHLDMLPLSWPAWYRMWYHPRKARRHRERQEWFHSRGLSQASVSAFGCRSFLAASCAATGAPCALPPQVPPPRQPHDLAAVVDELAAEERLHDPPGELLTLERRVALAGRRLGG